MARKTGLCCVVLLCGCQRHPLGATAEPRPLDASPTVTAASLGLHTAQAGSNTTSSTALEDAGAPLSTERQVCRVLVIGDSLTDQRSHGGGYLNAWTKRCPSCSFENLGRGGAMVNQMLVALRSHFASAPSAQYSFVVVFGGVNDLYSDETAHRTLPRIQADLSRIYQLARAHSKRVVAITVTPWGGFHRWYSEHRGNNTDALNRWITEQREENRLDYVIDAAALLSCGDPRRLCPTYALPFKDGLHFGPAGHGVLGTALLNALGDDPCATTSSDAARKGAER